MWRATIKGLAAKKTRLLLTTLSIVLGVGFMAGTFVLTDTMNATFDELFRDVTASTDVVVRSEPAFGGDTSGAASLDREPMPASIVQRIESVDGVAKASIDVAGYAQIVDPTTGEAIGGVGPPTLGNSWDGSTNSIVSLRSGEAPHGIHETAIDAATALRYGIGEGDRVQILFEGPERTFTVTGIIGIGEADNLAGATLALFDVPSAQRVLAKEGLADAVNIQAAVGVSATALRDRVAAALPAGAEAVTGTDLGNEQADAMQQELGLVRTALMVFAVVALFVGGFLILNTFTIIVTQRTKELALLRALGASRRQVLASVLGEAAIVGLVAGAIGIGAGIAVAFGLRALMEAFGADLPSTTMQLLPRTIWLSLAVGVGITALASVVPARRAAGVAPVEALRNGNGGDHGSVVRRVIAGSIVSLGGAGLLAAGLAGSGSLAGVGLGALVTFVGIALLSPIVVRPAVRAIGWPLRWRVTGRLGRENTMRNPRRTASTAAALMIGLGLAAFVAVFAASVRASVDRVIDESLRADLLVTTNTVSGFSPEVAVHLGTLSALDTVTSVRRAEIRIDGELATITGVDPASIEQVTALGFTSGSTSALGAKGILLYEDVAAEHGWSVGDAMRVEFAATGQRTFTVQGIYGRNELSGDYVISLDTMERNVTQRLDEVVLATVANGVPVAEARLAAEAALAAFPNVEVVDQSDFREQQAAQIDQLMTMITALLLLAIVISLFGIANTLTLSIHERRREIGLLRAVGTSRKQVRRMVLSESAIIATLGAMLGTAAGLFFGWAVYRGMAGSGIRELAIPAGQLAAYVLVAVMAGGVAGLLPAFRASRLDVLGSIAYE